jgi:DNA-binding MarR family transcriptional regulator
MKQQRPITETQAAILEAIKALAKAGATTTPTAIARQLTTPDHTWSGAAVTTHLKALERKGAIKRVNGTAPSIEVA